MTKIESIKLVQKITELDKQTPLYIKGFGTGKFRVMDHNHNPVMNIDAATHAALLEDKKIKLSGLIYIFV